MEQKDDLLDIPLSTQDVITSALSPDWTVYKYAEHNIVLSAHSMFVLDLHHGYADSVQVKRIHGILTSVTTKMADPFKWVTYEVLKLIHVYPQVDLELFGSAEQIFAPLADAMTDSIHDIEWTWVPQKHNSLAQEIFRSKERNPRPLTGHRLARVTIFK